MKCYTSLLWCVVLLSVTIVQSQRFNRQQGFLSNNSRCRTPDNYNGVCVALPSCPALLQLYANNGGSQQVVNYLRQSQRNCGNAVIRGNPVLCCTQPTNNNGGFQNSNTQQQNSNFTPNPNNPFLPNNGQRPPPQTEVPTAPPTTPSTTPPPPPPPPTPAPNRPVEQRIGTCVGPDAKFGSCKSLLECQPLLTRLQKDPNDASFAQFLRLSNQLCNAAPPTVCCPDENRNVNTGPIIPTLAPTIKPVQTVEARILTPQEGCGQSAVSHRKIVGGAPSELGAWPWLALLGYDGVDGIAFRCGGSLITKRHVVTAAHCIRNNLRLVRLGEHDLDRDEESQHLDVNVLRTKTHPNYNARNGHSDVAVVVLSRDVAFKSNISPICVPENINPRSLVGYTPFVAGWGRTKEGGDSASILQEVQLPILANSECKERYRAQNRLITEDQFDDAIVCAGVLTGGKDTCQGDSGGPLMLPDKLSGNTFYYNLLGIVSYGIGCAREGIPGVYASVPFFSDWIKEKVAEPI